MDLLRRANRIIRLWTFSLANKIESQALLDKRREEHWLERAGNAGAHAVEAAQRFAIMPTICPGSQYPPCSAVLPAVDNIHRLPEEALTASMRCQRHVSCKPGGKTTLSSHGRAALHGHNRGVSSACERNLRPTVRKAAVSSAWKGRWAGKRKSPMRPQWSSQKNHIDSRMRQAKCKCPVPFVSAPHFLLHTG